MYLWALDEREEDHIDLKIHDSQKKCDSKRERLFEYLLDEDRVICKRNQYSGSCVEIEHRGHHHIAHETDEHHGYETPSTKIL